MLRFVTDEHIDPALVRGLLARQPDLDIPSVLELGLRGILDPDLLEWAAGQNRLVVTHDRNTMASFAYDRVRAGEPMPGVVVVDDYLPMGRAIQELLILALCSKDGEWDNQVVYIPL